MIPVVLWEVSATMAEIITSEDPDLAAQVRAGDRTAIQTVVETYLGQILRAARLCCTVRPRTDPVSKSPTITP